MFITRHILVIGFLDLETGPQWLPCSTSLIVSHYVYYSTHSSHWLSGPGNRSTTATNVVIVLLVDVVVGLLVVIRFSKY